MCRAGREEKTIKWGEGAPWGWGGKGATETSFRGGSQEGKMPSVWHESQSPGSPYYLVTLLNLDISHFPGKR